MTADVLKLTPSETFEFVTNALLCGQVPYIAGPPAIGKSQVVYQVADAANAKVIDLRLSQILSEDLTGLPERDEKTGKAKYLPFETFPLEGDKIPDGYSGWLLFLDELSSASEEVLAAAYSLILDRTVGGRKLHKKCVVVAAGNRATDSAIARELPDTLITRMLPIEMTYNHRDWLDWAENFEGANQTVVEFIKKNPSLLYGFTKADQRAELEVYPTPRGWEKVFAHMNFHENKSTNKKLEREDAAGISINDECVSELITESIFNLMAAAVGHMAARSLREDYDEAIQLPYPWEVAQSPSSQRIPLSNTGKAKLTVDLAKYFLEQGADPREAVLSYMNRIGGEYSELFLNQIKENIGSTASDKKLYEKVAKRLSIDPLLVTLANYSTKDSSDPDSPF